ncbi:MAG: BREX-1 system adenine-specific DNA-methyltransferase PglX, partial [Pseudomonadaceae bacterium]|nr:BREX-1 system adenine-specific DNA-methyltransferase PglX [Pseudomonadaceae bacterium]
MNTNNIKSYAPKARSAFIAAMTKQAAKYGISAKGIEPLEQKGDLALIGDRAFPASIIRPRAALVQKVAQLGFAQAMEQAAYSWFNRLCAIRFMELKGYLDHGLRVLSHPSQPGGFQILDDCLNIELPGLDKQRITELKLDGNQDEALYRELLLAQCHLLHQAMPFLFEAIDDQTELLLPDNLTKTDSLIRELVDAIPEEDWQDIEIIGWLYQFYISEKKEQVIGKVVKSEDIPAATQLFTPNWIVKYMVQNSLGAQWLATYPDSPLKAQMAYYIEPAEQTDEVNAQLAAITPSALNPEELTLIDPACGSGHILVEGYELFKAIYLERGYRQRDVAQLILENNLFGLDIDGRAAQLTGFALMMKGRADDRRLFERGVKLNVMSLVDSAGFDPDVVASGVKLADYGLLLGDLAELKRLFEHATTFGSLIQVPEGLAKKLPGLKRLCEVTSQDLFVADELKSLWPLVRQAALLAAQYDAVVANPPYMGGGGMNAEVKKFVKDYFPEAKSDLFACFIERGFVLAKVDGQNAMVTMESWMFLSSYENFRKKVLQQYTLQNLAHFPYDGKRPTAMGINFGVAAFCAKASQVPGHKGRYCCSRYYELNDNGIPFEFPTVNERLNIVAADEFEKIPGSPIAYGLSESLRATFGAHKSLSEVARPKEGLNTTDNDRFLRRWWECGAEAIKLDARGATDAAASRAKWFPCQKGGAYRRWYGNSEFVVNWGENGREIKSKVAHQYGSISKRVVNEHLYFREGISWSSVTSLSITMRYVRSGQIFETAGNMCFFDAERELLQGLGFCNSCVADSLLQVLSPTLSFKPGPVGKLPFAEMPSSIITQIVSDAVRVAEVDWNAYERSWDFQSLPLLTVSSETPPTLESSYTAWVTQNRDIIAEMKRLEEENNRLFIDAYGLANELTPDVPIEQITLTINPAYRYSGKMSKEELWTRFREDSMQELVSYAIGCMMGRYSLDAPGLIYANSGNEGFDPSRYSTFPADDDGIVPLTDKEWFADDAANRLVEFIALTWDKTHLEDNLRFLADNLSPKKGEGSRDTLRRYLCDSFFKDHLQTYKKRPIYWLFSSGKQKAFQCLVYLHRYNASTLSRMRTLHVIPLSAKLNSYANKLEQDIDASTSTAEKKALEKQLATLHNQQAELAIFDEKLRHYADQRITLDLDDGVKVNYGKFGDLLAEVKA